ncbi:beta-xylanase [Parastagonospora nodorum]|nr:beta-xylanase [Parastagonospora nodorum]KAH3976659.1 beta-xylanase [Parastagonospora nodorum]KAH3982218.1 beta-xylanase [Parastagonospora nodorum]KAH4040751.1 beta-xylanase [Parastagonospora nodorum]KAH4058693.1 beta-xylanase [Parastagonospora nodorum]
MYFSNIVASLALAGSALALPNPPTPPAPGCPAPHPSTGPPGPPGTPSPPKHSGSPTPPATESLYQSFKKAGRDYIGVAVTIRNETKESDIIRSEFNSITPENAMKWESTEPSQGNFTLAGGDAIIALAKQNKQEVRCHTLVWHSQLPLWVSEGGFDNATLIQVMEDHIKAVAGRWKGACTQWDVVNEALNEDGTYRESVWYKTIGEAYIPIAFKLAKKYTPDSLLFYNDYNIEDNGAKTQGAVRIVKLIQSYGIHIDGVGYQAHLTSEATPSNPGAAPGLSTLTAALRSTADLGVKVAYTELDVRKNDNSTSEASTAAQVAVWNNCAKACLAVKECIGMTVWGVSDKYSWIPGVFKGEGAGLLWDDNYNKKAVYGGFLSGIKGN